VPGIHVFGPLRAKILKFDSNRFDLNLMVADGDQERAIVGGRSFLGHIDGKHSSEQY